ncbi:hypothetical protein EON68_03415 [archaeon]|nr:MAG: hypothetical protein EON68_03415 [archaeon]
MSSAGTVAVRSSSVAARGASSPSMGGGTRLPSGGALASSRAGGASGAPAERSPRSGAGMALCLCGVWAGSLGGSVVTWEGRRVRASAGAP